MSKRPLYFTDEFDPTDRKKASGWWLRASWCIFCSFSKLQKGPVHCGSLFKATKQKLMQDGRRNRWAEWKDQGTDQYSWRKTECYQGKEEREKTLRESYTMP